MAGVVDPRGKLVDHKPFTGIGLNDEQFNTDNTAIIEAVKQSGGNVMGHRNSFGPDPCRHGG